MAFGLAMQKLLTQKTRFWKEKSVEDVVTLGPTAQATLVTIMKEVCDHVFGDIIK
jgi:hypothetical protein